MIAIKSYSISVKHKGEGVMDNADKKNGFRGRFPRGYESL